MTRSWHRQAAVLVLLLAGIGLWNRFGAISTRYLFIAPVIALALAAIPPIRRRFSALAQRADDSFNCHRAIVAICIGALFAAHLLSQAYRCRSELFLKFHDEHVYLIQAHMLAQGRLWLPPIPPQITDFFDSFYLILDRAYAGMYPPGTAIMLLPGVSLGLAHWIMPLITSSFTIVFLYLLLSEIFTPTKAIVGIILMAGSMLYLSISLMALSEAPFIFAQVLAFWAWIRWRQNRKAISLILLGIAVGYGAITRPADMFCIAAAIAFAIAFELRTNPKHLLKSAAIISLAVLPFLGLQLIQNAGITGNWNESPIRYYTDRNYPAPILSFRPVTAHDVPPTNCLPKQAAIKQWILPDYEQHAQLTYWQIWYPERIKELLQQTLPNPLLLILLPASVLSLNEIRRATIASSALLFCLLYTADAVFLPHYLVAIEPAIVCLVLAGWESIERATRSFVANDMAILMLAISLATLPEFNRSATLLGSSSTEQRTIDRALASLPPRPTLVLFDFDPKVNSFHTEPVYNDDVANPDDAPIIRARDLGPDENIRLYRYYRTPGQDREVYQYNRAAPEGQNPLTRLGTINELAVP